MTVAMIVNVPGVTDAQDAIAWGVADLRPHPAPRPQARRGTALNHRRARLDHLEALVTRWLARYSVDVLRVSLGLVFLGFGLLKFVPGLSPAQDLAEETVTALTLGLVPGGVGLVLVATLETAIGLSLTTGRYLRLGLALLGVAMVGILSPLVLAPDALFARPYQPTLEGQYVLKDLVLLAASLVVAASVRLRRSVVDQDEPTSGPTGDATVIATSTLPTNFSPAQVAAYLDRIGYHGPTAPTPATLRGIYRAHLFAVPYETLDILPLGRPLSLHPEALYDKVVRRRRGGVCYELNGLLGTVLRDLGYQVTFVAAQFVHEDGSFSPPFDHLALVVAAPESPDRWLVDVAAGRRSSATPLPLVDGHTDVQAEVGRGFRLTAIGDRWHLDERIAGERWAPVYAFRLIPRTLTDFRERCRYHEHDPASFCRRGPLCTLPTPGGRLTLSGDRLITTIAGVRQERTVAGEEFADVLRDAFRIDLAA